MYRKRGQITIFIIVGVILLIIVGVSLYMVNLGKESQIKEEIGDFNPTNVILYVESCLELTSKQGVNEVLVNGGYIVIPPGLDKNGFAVWYEDGKVAPSLEEIRANVEDYVISNFNDCISDFESFRDYIIEYNEEPIIDVEINQKSVSVSLSDYNLRIQRGDMSRTENKFNTILPINLKGMYNIASLLLELKSTMNFNIQVKQTGIEDDIMYTLEPVGGYVNVFILDRTRADYDALQFVIT